MGNVITKCRQEADPCWPCALPRPNVKKAVKNVKKDVKNVEKNNDVKNVDRPDRARRLRAPPPFNPRTPCGVGPPVRAPPKYEIASARSSASDKSASARSRRRAQCPMYRIVCASTLGPDPNGVWELD